MAGRITEPDFDRIYNREWFEGHHALRGEYRQVADVVHEIFAGPRSCVDIGCGMAFVIERLAELGWSVHGLDGSKYAVELAPALVRDRVEQMDLTLPMEKILAARDSVVAICTEVAEHLRSEFSDVLVDRVAYQGHGGVLFTAATPGQGGNDHVNEQPLEYWISKFQARGFEVDHWRTDRARMLLMAHCQGMHWFGKNTLVFRRPTTT